MSKSNYLENKVLDHVMGKASFTMPSNVYLALTTVVPSDTSTGSTITEANYTGYARLQIPASSLNSASNGQITNSAQLVFPDCTGGSSTIVGFAICDASTGGNVLYWGTVSPSKLIDTSNTPPTVPVNGLTITED